MKKGNVQLTESILVMFFVLIIIAISLVVFYRFQLGSLRDYENEYRDKQILASLITIPKDFDYTLLGKSENAVDSSKLFGNFDYGYKTIYVEVIYPSGQRVECDVHNYPNCNYFAVYDNPNPRFENFVVESRPVSVYYPLENKFKPGKLVIKWYY